MFEHLLERLTPVPSPHDYAAPPPRGLQPPFLDPLEVSGFIDKLIDECDEKGTALGPFCFCAVIEDWAYFAEFDFERAAQTVFRLPAAQCGY